MTYRHYTAPWGIRHVARWALNGLAWLASWGHPPETARGICGTTPGPFTVWWVTDPDPSVIAHEECHQRQCRWMGWRHWAWMWIVETIRHGYAGNTLERMARQWAETGKTAWEAKMCPTIHVSAGDGKTICRQCECLGPRGEVWTLYNYPGKPVHGAFCGPDSAWSEGTAMWCFGCVRSGYADAPFEVEARDEAEKA